jgi:DNA-binding CsgD family transcriptional regulator
MAGEELFVGRARELALLRRRLDRAVTGRGSLVVIAGEPGIGKTALAAAGDEVARAMGMAVAWGCCSDPDGAPPFWPWRQLLRNLGGPLPALDGGARQADTERFQVFADTEAALHDLARARPVLLVLDDLQWADPDSLRLLRFLAPVLAELPLILVATYRDTDLDESHPLPAMVEQLASQQACELIRLTGMSATDLGVLARHHGSSVPVSTLAADTAGNPFFAVELLRADPDRDGLPSGVAASIRGRLAALPATAREVLECAALAGRGIEIGLVAAALQTSPDTVTPCLAQARQRGLLRAGHPDSGDPGGGDPDSDAPGGSDLVGGCEYAFTHDLVRTALISGLEPVRAAGLHLALAHGHEKRARTETDRVTAVARHACAGASDPPSRRWASDCARAAGELAERVHAYDTALVWLARAADLLGPDEPGHLDLLLAQGQAARCAGDLPRFRQVMRTAWDAVETGAHPDRAVDVALALARGVEPTGRPDAELRRVLESIEHHLPLDHLPPHQLAPNRRGVRLAVAARIALERYWEDPDRARTLASELVEQARDLDDIGALVPTLRALHYSLRGPEDHDRRRALRAELVGLARKTGDVDLELEAARVAVSDALQRHPVDVDREMQALEDLHRRTRRPLAAWYHGLFRAIRAAITGRSEEALRVLDDVEVLGDRLGLASSPLFVTTQRFLVLRDLDRPAGHEPDLRRLTEAFPAIAGLRCQLVLLLADGGRHAEATALLDELSAEQYRALHHDLTWIACVASLTETAALLEDHRVAELYEMLAPHRGRVAEAGPAGWTGAVDRPLGLAAGVLGRWDTAEQHFADALRLHERWGAVPLAAATLRGHATVLRRRDHLGDRTRAADLDAQAAALRPTSTAPTRTAPGAGLTRREEEILGLLGSGATNKDIARELVLSVHTVERHVANIYRKLGVRNRSQATVRLLTEKPSTTPRPGRTTSRSQQR